MVGVVLSETEWHQQKSEPSVAAFVLFVRSINVTSQSRLLNEVQNFWRVPNFFFFLNQEIQKEHAFCTNFA